MERNVERVGRLQQGKGVKAGKEGGGNNGRKPKYEPNRKRMPRWSKGARKALGKGDQKTDGAKVQTRRPKAKVEKSRAGSIDEIPKAAGLGVRRVCERKEENGDEKGRKTRLAAEKQKTSWGETVEKRFKSVTGTKNDAKPG